MSALLKAAEAVVAARFSPANSWDELKNAIGDLADAIHQSGEEAESAPKDDGGPAFPVASTVNPDGNQSGMRLLDWFAGMALANIGSNYAARGYIGPEAKEHADQIAAHAYNIADAMLAARKEGA